MDNYMVELSDDGSYIPSTFVFGDADGNLAAPKDFVNTHLPTEETTDLDWLIVDISGLPMDNKDEGEQKVAKALEVAIRAFLDGTKALDAKKEFPSPTPSWISGLKQAWQQVGDDICYAEWWLVVSI